MYDKNVKSGRILTKLRVLDYEYIRDRVAKFHDKTLFITRVINIQIRTTKYFSFQCSVRQCICSVRLLTHETPDFITPALWPANSPDLNPVDYQIWGKLQKRVYRSQIRDVDQLKSCLIEEFLPGGHRWSCQAVASTSSSLRSSTRWKFWTQTLGVLKSCHSHGRTLESQSRVCQYWTLMLLSAVAIADTDQFCWNLVTCLQFKVSVLA